MEQRSRGPTLQCGYCRTVIPSIYGYIQTDTAVPLEYGKLATKISMDMRIFFAVFVHL